MEFIPFRCNSILLPEYPCSTYSIYQELTVTIQEAIYCVFMEIIWGIIRRFVKDQKSDQFNARMKYSCNEQTNYEFVTNGKFIEILFKMCFRIDNNESHYPLVRIIPSK